MNNVVSGKDNFHQAKELGGSVNLSLLLSLRSESLVGSKSFSYIPTLSSSGYSSIMLGRDHQKFETQVWRSQSSDIQCSGKRPEQLRQSTALSDFAITLECPAGGEKQSQYEYVSILEGIILLLLFYMQLFLYMSILPFSLKNLSLLKHSII